MSALVIGGGITGLVAARALAHEGVPVLLAEAAPHLGGKIRTERLDGFVVEHGPDSFLATRPAAISLARDLGLADELTGTRDPRVVYIRREGKLVPLPEGLGLVLPTKLLPLVRTRLFSWPEKLRMAVDVVAPRRLGEEDVAVGAYLRDRLGDALVDRLAGPLVGGVYNTPIDELSLDAVVPQLRIAEHEHRSLLLAGLADGRRMRKATARAAATETVPATAAPSSSRPLGVFVSLRGGLDRFVDALAESALAAGADLRTSLRVVRLERAGSGAAARFGDGTSRRFDAVIIAAPAPVGARLLGNELPAAARALEAIPHGTSILVTLAYATAATPERQIGHGYLIPRSEGGAIAACTRTSEKWSGRAPEETTLLRMFVRDEDEWTARPDEALVALAAAEAQRTLGIAAEPLFTRVARYGSSMPRYTVGHLGRVAAVEAALGRWPAVVATGASFRGVGLPDCVSQGQAAATRVLERVGDTRPPSPEEAREPTIAGVA